MKKRFAFLLTVTVLLGACSADSQDVPVQEEEVPLPTVQVWKVDTGLQRTFETTGEVTPSQSAQITAQFGADVLQIHKQIGETVAVGDPILTISSDEVRERYNTAANGYNTASQNVAQTRVSMERSVESARAAVKTAETDLENLLKQNKAKRTQAEEAFNASKLGLDLSMAADETAFDNAVRSAETSVQTALISIDSFLEVTQARTDNDYIKEIHIGVRDPIHKAITKEQWTDLNRYFQTTFDGSYQSTIELLRDCENLLNEMVVVLKNSVTSDRYTQAALTADTNQMTGQLNTIRSAVSSIEAAKRKLDTTKQSVGSKSQTTITAKTQYQTTLADLQAAEDAARRRLTEAELALENAETNAILSQLSAQSSFTNAAGELQQAGISNSDLIIRAPFNGKIADIPVRVGDEVRTGDLLTRMENDSLLIIEGSVSSDEAALLRTGDPVDIVEYGTAEIATIAPSADPITKKYLVQIFYADPTLKAGELVALQFHTAMNGNGDSRIFLPVTAIHISAAETFVWTVETEDGKTVVQKQPVTIGKLSGDQVEIPSGLRRGDTVVISGGRTIDDAGTEVSITRS